MIRKATLLVALVGVLAVAAGVDRVLRGGGTDILLAELLRPNRRPPGVLIRGAMQDPQCWTQYRRHRAAGSSVSYGEFAHGCALAGAFRW